MTTRRRLLLFGLPVALVLAGVCGLVLWTQPRTAITRENAAKINEGMTLAEVEAIMGGPARDESTGPLNRTDVDDADVAPGERKILLSFYRVADPGCYHLEWKSDTVRLLALFGPDDCVVSYDPMPVRRADESLVERLSRWFDL